MGQIKPEVICLELNSNSHLGYFINGYDILLFKRPCDPLSL